MPYISDVQDYAQFPASTYSHFLLVICCYLWFYDSRKLGCEGTDLSAWNRELFSVHLTTDITGAQLGLMFPWYPRRQGTLQVRLVFPPFTGFQESYLCYRPRRLGRPPRHSRWCSPRNIPFPPNGISRRSIENVKSQHLALHSARSYRSVALFRESWFVTVKSPPRNSSLQSTASFDHLGSKTRR